MKKYVVVGVAVAGLTSGSVAVAALAPLGVAGAHDNEKAEHPHRAGRPGALLDGALSSLVDEGTISGDQADRVRERVREHAAALREQFGQKMSGLKAKMGASAEQVAGILGVSVDELKAQVRDGKTLGEIAGDQRDALVAALTDAANERIDAAVEKGKLTAERAASLKEKTAERIARLVDEGLPKGRHGAFRGPR
jgi:polyhydroxyalkanoate synthesis regulator phasin